MNNNIIYLNKKLSLISNNLIDLNQPFKTIYELFNVIKQDSKNLDFDLNDLRKILSKQDYFSTCCLLNLLIKSKIKDKDILYFFNLNDVKYLNCLFFDVVFYQYGIFCDNINLDLSFKNINSDDYILNQINCFRVEQNNKDEVFAPYLSLTQKMKWLRGQVV